MTAIVTVPPVVLAPEFPTTADRQAGIYNAKAKAWADGENAMATSVRDIAVSAATNASAAQEMAQAAASSATAANTMASFKGLWSALAGQLPRPATVLDNGAYWVLLQDLADVAAVRPGTDPAVWSPQILPARDIGAANLNLTVNTGSYTVSGAITNGPVGVSSAVVNVTHAGSVAVQMLHDTVSGASWVRTASALTTVPVWTAWGRITQDNTQAVPLAGGAMDCSKGTYFTETISVNSTLSFDNVPAGAYACVLEVRHTGGAITLPVGSVWVAATPPTLNTPRRHLLFFQRAMTGNGGWIVSALPNSAV